MNVKGVHRQRLSRRVWRSKWVVLSACLLLISVAAAAVELHTAYFQSRLFSTWASDLTYSVKAGPHEEVRFPQGGPQDLRLGYARLSSFIESLDTHDFAIVRQSEPSPALEDFT